MRRSGAITSFILPVMGVVASGCSVFQPKPLYLHDGPAASAPIGLVALCREQPKDCVGTPIDPARADAPPNPAELGRVNKLVNSSMRPAPDGDGATDKWSIASPLSNAAGDCEDFALEKQRLLEDAGWPRERLRLAVVVPPRLGTHAVLVATTDAGDVVLDNLTSDVRLWSDTGYVFLKRQSGADDLVWYAVSASRR